MTSRLLFAVLVASWFSAVVMADAVSGRVYGPDGKPRPNETCTVGTASPVKFKTDASGSFSVYLEAGRYEVTSDADPTVKGTIESYPQPIQQDVHLKKK